MNILILTEAGKNIGFGHLTRCIALYQAIEDEGNRAFLNVNGDSTVIEFLKDKNHRISDWSKEEDKLAGLLDRYDFAIVDSYLAEKSFYDKVSDLMRGRLLMIDDYNRIEYPKGVVVNPSIYGDQLEYSGKNGAKYLLGRDYVILRKEFWDAPEKEINEEVKNVLITFGGINNTEFLMQTLEFLSKYFPHFTYHVVTNNNLNLPPKADNLNLYSNLSASEMLDLMLKADICISGGGQTTYELARVGVPTIGICFAYNQKLNLEPWQENGFLTYVGGYKEDNILEEIKETIQKFMSHEERERRNRLSKGCIDSKGSKRIADFIKAGF